MSGPIDTYVSDLARSLPGPRQVRRDLLAELTDGLRDAADAHRATGLPPREAELRAVRENGPLDDLVPDYRAELATKSGQHTAMLLAVTILLTTVAWDLIWYVVPGGGPPLPHVVTLAGVIMWTAVACAALCGLGALLLARSARRALPVRLINAAVVAVGSTTIVVVVASSLAMNLLNGGAAVGMFETSAPLIGLVIASGVAVTVMTRALLSTARTTFALER